MVQHTPVMSARRLKSEIERHSAACLSEFRQRNGPSAGGALRPFDNLCRRSTPNQSAKPEIVPSQIGEQADQYRATRTIATTSKAAISESVRSRVLERGEAPASSGGMTQLSLRRRLQFPGKPAVHAGLHRIVRYAYRVNMTALLALECSIIESIWSRHDFGKQHPRLHALWAMRPLDGGKMRRS